MINEKQARLIAHVLHEIRPAWGIEGTMKVLERNNNHPSPFADVMAAAVMAARDPETQTPGRIFTVHSHWPEDAKRKLPPPPPCADHPTFDSHTCRCCWSDIKTGQRPETHIGKHWQQPGIYDHTTPTPTETQPKDTE